MSAPRLFAFMSVMRGDIEVELEVSGDVDGHEAWVENVTAEAGAPFPLTRAEEDEAGECLVMADIDARTERWDDDECEEWERPEDFNEA